MRSGTQLSSGASTGVLTDRMDTTLSKLNEEGLSWLLSQPIARDMRRKVERRLRRMKAKTPNAQVTGRSVSDGPVD